MSGRRSGVLLHIASLPCRHGLGDFGPQAHEFVGFLSRAGQQVWQMLPLTPINAGAGNSPYSSYSAFAGNIYFISPDLLLQDGLLHAGDLYGLPVFPADRVDYDAACRWRRRLLGAAFDNALPGLRDNGVFAGFCAAEAYWLDDFCLFMALKSEQGDAPWYRWPLPLRLRDPEALTQARRRLGYEILQQQFWQFLFARQWQQLREHAQLGGVTLFGDVPIYVSMDSCDVWAHRELFELDDEGLPVFCAGAPPDYFSKTGQMWGNPVYAWECHERDGYGWWVRRLQHEQRRFDLIRLDHFRGFAGFWQVPACEPTAENGLWIPGPGSRFFATMRWQVPELQLVAEDLGVITEDVVELMEEFGFPGMKVLQFAFSEDLGGNAYIPHNIPVHSVVYTGTHDNNTVRGWYADELDAAGRERVAAYIGRTPGEEEIAAVVIRMALGSVAELCIVPMQDYLGLDRSGRMNIPGVAGGNWGWRLRPELITSALELTMRTWVDVYGRRG